MWTPFKNTFKNAFKKTAKNITNTPIEQCKPIDEHHDETVGPLADHPAAQSLGVPLGPQPSEVPLETAPSSDFDIVLKQNLGNTVKTTFNNIFEKTRQRFSTVFSKIIPGKSLEAQDLETLYEALIMADVGPAYAATLTKGIMGSTLETAQQHIAKTIEMLMQPYAAPLPSTPIVMLVGINGSGKTTTIGKLIDLYASQGNTVQVIAGDTFRAAATEQLQSWVQRGQRAFPNKITFFPGQPRQDPAAVVFQGLEAAGYKVMKNLAEQSHDRLHTDQSNHSQSSHKKSSSGQPLDKTHSAVAPSTPSLTPLSASSFAMLPTILIDTAGRLHNNANLMQELEKIYRIILKFVPPQQCSVLLTLDATTGQNTLIQADLFAKALPLTGFVVNKMDGSSKGGFLIPLTQTLKKPICAIGTGETVADLEPFDAAVYAASLVGIMAADDE